MYTLCSYNAKSQSITKFNEIKIIDSLISLNLNADKIESIGKSEVSIPKARGINPCDTDYDNILILFKSLRSNYISCCNKNSNYLAVARILNSIYSLMNNPNCKWGVVQWAVFAYHLNDYAKFVDRNDCCK